MRNHPQGPYKQPPKTPTIAEKISKALPKGSTLYAADGYSYILGSGDGLNSLGVHRWVNKYDPRSTDGGFNVFRDGVKVDKILRPYIPKRAMMYPSLPQPKVLESEFPK